MSTPSHALPPKRFVFTHHKCASAWSRGVFDRVCQSLGLAYAPRSSFPHARRETEQARREVALELGAASKADVIFDANATRYCLEVAELLDPGFRAVHIVRDPRDVLVSAYFSHRAVHPTDRWPALAVQRTRLAQMTEEDGLLDEIEFASFCLDAITDWDYAHPRVSTVRYEELFAGDPRPVVERMLAWLELAPPRAALDAILEVLDFERLSGGRGPGAEDRAHHYRKGVAGDWRNHFTPAVARAFDARYGGALAAAGYAAEPATHAAPMHA